MLSLEYVAGIIDGEGTIIFDCVFAKSGESRSMRTLVNVTMTHRGVIRALHEQFGGSYWEYPPRRDGAAPLCRWRVASWDAFNFLKIVLPYLIVKKKQAELAMEFHERYKNKELSTGERMVYKDLMHILNKRGVAKGLSDNPTMSSLVTGMEDDTCQ